MRRAVVTCALLLAAAAPLQGQDQGSLADLAVLLQLEDRREFDVGPLQRAAQHPDALVRVRAAMAMGRIGDRVATPLLLRLLADPDSLVRTEAAFALGELEDSAAVRELAGRLRRMAGGTASETDLEIVTALAKIGGPEADQALAEVLQAHPAGATDGTDRATAAVLLEAWRLGPTSRTARLLAPYVRLASGEWRRNATYAATRLRLPAAADAYLEATEDADPLVRGWAARGLTLEIANASGTARDAFVNRLRTLVTDSSAQVRINALRALATFADSGLASIAQGRMVDRDPNVPVQAATTLGSLGGSRAAVALAERYNGAGTWALRRATLLALAQVAPERALEVGHALQDDNDWRQRALYVEMLGAAASPAARSQLLALATTENDGRVLAGVLAALGQSTTPGDTDVVLAARGRLTHADPVVRSAATELIAREQDRRTIQELVQAYRRAQADELNDARLAAVQGLAGLAERDVATRGEVESALLGAFPRSPDPLVRRLVAQRFGEAAHRRYWGAVGPIETGRSLEEYRELARRFVLRQQPPSAVTIETERGTLTIQLKAWEAPLTVDNFLRLVDRHYFDNGRWHRVVPNFVIQDGDPRGDGAGGPGTVIRDEINRARYQRGTVGMALSGPDTGGSQFFITHSPQPHLDGGYTAFGQVASGWEVLDQITQGDRIRRIVR
jgi:cyclophilin family peptidyl-prolyl cis-trans isomerase/HEAT repeat protein